VTAVLAGIVLLWPPPVAAELTGPLVRGLGWETNPRAAQRALVAAGARPRHLVAAVAQEYADGLLRSHLLAALNRAGAQHRLLDAAAAAKLEFLVAETQAATVTLAFAEGQLEAALLRIPVPPDQATGGRDNPFERARLAPQRQALSQLVRQGCRLQPQPVGRNAFVFRGNCGSNPSYVEYLPEHDELWVLHYRAR
jgi:hypothetical protein